MYRCGFFRTEFIRRNCLFVPPITLITRALFYLRKQQAKASVVVPFWPSSYFWPVIRRQLAHYVVDYKVFNGREALEHGRNTNALLGSSQFLGEIIAFRMNFTSRILD